MDPIAPYANGVPDPATDAKSAPLDVDLTLKAALARPMPSGPAAEALATPASTADSADREDDSVSPDPATQLPPAGIEDRAQLAPLTEPSRQLEEPVAQALHSGGEQAATAAGDARLVADEPISAGVEAVPAFNADVTEQEDDVAMVVDKAPAVVDGALPLQTGEAVPAHAGEGALPSAPPTFPGLADPTEPLPPPPAPSAELAPPLSPSTTSPSLKRRPSPTPLEDDSAKRQRLTPPPVAAPAPAAPAAVEPAVPTVEAGVEDEDMDEFEVVEMEDEGLPPPPPPPQPPVADELPSVSTSGIVTPGLEEAPAAAAAIEPAVEPAAPVVESAAPVVESSAPVVESAAAEPAVEAAVAPVVAEEVKPAEALAPAIEPPVTAAAGPVEAPVPSSSTVPAAAPEEDVTTRTRVLPGTPGQTKLSKDQHRFLRNVLTQLRRNRNQGPFANPVDPVALGIPHYPNVIKRPMDLKTAEDRLGRLDKSATTAGSLYRSADEFVADVRLIWQNCYTFNGRDAAISKMADDMAAAFEGYLKKLPPDEPPYVPPPPQPAKPAKAESPVTAAAPASADRKASAGASPGIRRNSSADGLHRPKREIKAPEKELPYFAEQAEKEAAKPKARRHSTLPTMVPNTREELRFCRDVMKEVYKKQHEAYAWPFYDPVDHVALNLADYTRIIKKPMDLSNINAKLAKGEYKNGAAFAADFRLMFNNCFTYNPQGQDVFNMGKQLEKVFETKWLDRPPEKVVAPQTEPEDEEDEVSSEQQALRDKIAALQAQLQQSEKGVKKVKKPKSSKVSPVAQKTKPRPSNGSSGSARPSKPKHSHSMSSASASALHRPRKSISYREDDYDYDYDGSDGGAGRRGEDDYDVISYEQKKDLATRIQDAQEPLQSDAISLIRRSRPDLVSADGEEIELDIDALDDRTLYKLFKLVCQPGSSKRSKPKKHRTMSDSRLLTASGQLAKKSGRAGTGGPKRQGLDETQEAAKIAQLQSQLQAFNQDKPSAAPAPPEYASSSSDSESESDSDEE